MSPRRSRRKPAVSVLKVAETAVMANVVTSNIFGADLRQFFTGRTGTSSIYNPNTGDSIVTLPEMLGIDQMGMRNGQPAVFKSIDSGLQMDKLKANIKANAVPLVTQLVTIPFAFRMAKKLTAGSIVNPTNKMLRTVGIKEVKL